MAEKQFDLVPELPSITEVRDEEGYTKGDLKKARESDFEARITSRYKNIYKVTKGNFKFWANKRRKSKLEILSEFDPISGELTKIKGWLEVPSDKDEYNSESYAEVSLNPVRTENGVIYHFKGTLEWTVGDYEGKVVPLSVVPIYGFPSGRIVELRSTKIGDSHIFDNAKIEYRSLELRMGEEQ